MDNCIVDCNPDLPLPMMVILILFGFFCMAKMLKSVKDDQDGRRKPPPQ